MLGGDFEGAIALGIRLAAFLVYGRDKGLVKHITWEKAPMYWVLEEGVALAYVQHTYWRVVCYSCSALCLSAGTWACCYYSPLYYPATGQCVCVNSCLAQD